MAFTLSTRLSIQEVTAISIDTAFDPLRDRVMAQTATSLSWAICRERNAYIFMTDGVDGMYGATRGYYLFFCFGRFFDIRALSLYRPEVSFYNFPADFSGKRSDIKALFSEAAPIYGWFGTPTHPDENALFQPVFGPDDVPLPPN